MSRAATAFYVAVAAWLVGAGATVRGCVRPTPRGDLHAVVAFRGQR